MRDMLLVGGFAMPYGTIVGVAGPIFSGLMLQYGIEKAAIGIIVSLAQFTAVLQTITFRLTDLPNPRALVIGVGTFEILFTVSVITAPLWVPAQWTFVAVVALVMLGWGSAQLLIPTFNTWFAGIVPPELRGRYISRRTFVQYSVGIAASLLAGRFIDAVPGYGGFAVLYGVACVFGLATYWVLFRTPLPRLGGSDDDDEGRRSHWQQLLTPLRNAEYRWFVAFNLLLTAVLTLPGPYYNVFMIDHLSLSYSTIAVFTSTQMVVIGLGFRLWGAIVDRFGGKPMIQLLFVPTIVMPSLWAFASPESYWTVPLAMILGGLGYSGLSIANSIMLYAIIPQDGRKSSYFATWSVSVGVASAVAPALGSAVIGLLDGVEITILGAAFNRYHVLFMLASACGVVPGLMVARLPQLGSDRPGVVISQLRRGNPFSLAYNFFLLGRAGEPNRQAGLLRSLGRSRSPLAVGKLLASLEDPNPDVRRSATLALGDTGQPEVLEVLTRHLADAESDIRREAARALGALREGAAVVHLVEALDDSDPEVRMAAADALGKLPEPESRDALVERLRGPFDRSLMPVIVDALSHGPYGESPGDTRMVPIAADLLPRFRSRAVRHQVIQAVARALGFGAALVRVSQMNPYDRDANLQERIGAARTMIGDLPWSAEEALGVVTRFERMARAVSDGASDRFYALAASVAADISRISDGVGSEVPTEVSVGCALPGQLQDNGYLSESEDHGIMFIVLLIQRMVARARARLDRSS